MPNIINNILERIGNTPLVRLNRVVEPGMAAVLAKLESANPGGSVKDRICLGMVEEAEKKGLLKPGSVIVEPTSGNTGIGLAMVGAVKGYRVILTMPDTMSLERIQILKNFGAEVILTPGAEGMAASVKKAAEILKKIPNAFMPQQFINKDNAGTHKKTTGREILDDTGGRLDAFVMGVGTGGTISGVGEALKEHSDKIRVVGVEPASSNVISGGKPGPHRIQGIGAGFVPEILNRKVIDQMITVTDEDSFKMTKRLCQEEGLFVGISSGAAVLGALKVAEELGKGKTVVTMLCDTGERYLSMEPYFDV